MSVMNLFDLKGKVAIITGGGRGLGEGMAEALSEAGATVVLCSRKVEACEEVKKRIEEKGGKAKAHALDVTDAEQVERVVAAVQEDYGHIDILVNNSGTSWGGYPPEEMAIDKFQKVVNVNLVGAFIMTQAVGKRMIAAGTKGRIVNIASIAGFRGSKPEVMQAIGYNSSKGGLITMTKDFAVNWGKYGITVNGIAPGFIPTKMTKDVIAPIEDKMIANVPVGRLGQIQDMQGTVLYLASDAASFMTGQMLILDGGVLSQ
ncbi:glucose 1-dehydrogenase [Geomicrobium sp. JCM 19039]|uniref:glucose 1-dehydrogenase n=1 Tax=Geomicrobium sp. JCM 19039 TaxID=1460636 RepID=UPI00045F311E|nr:glucose 1-dehydrogenase [Geomicrobium sp. JCM 19039]GAK11514.1 3-oxoacyl-[acyl-carrier protein] reductase [Geomicrobium sp. JCM 19039]